MDEAINLTKLEEHCKSNSHRIDELERRQSNLDKLATTMSVMANELEHIKSDVGETKNNVRMLTEKPGRRWDAIVDKFIWLAVSGGIGYLLAAIGLE